MPLSVLRPVLRPALAFALLAGLAACGADGDPVAPQAKPAVKPGLVISGDARVGVKTEL